MHANRGQGASDIGELLRTAREQRGWTVSFAARASGVSRTLIMKLEQGEIDEPSARRMRALCELYDLDVTDVFVTLGYLSKPKGEAKGKDSRLLFAGQSITPYEAKALQTQLNIIRGAQARSSPSR